MLRQHQPNQEKAFCLSRQRNYVMSDKGSGAIRQDNAGNLGAGSVLSASETEQVESSYSHNNFNINKLCQKKADGCLP